ncbi:hypothetical protein N9891_00140 [bacterium]|nr:hypothetical protein [bacterium]
MIRSIILVMFMAGSASAGPLSPYSLPLEKNNIQTIPVHTEIDTLLIFPSEIESILGNGLTKGGEVTGSVLYGWGEKKPKHLVLRHLDSESQILMTIVMGESAFVFRLIPDAAPASVIYLQESDTEIPKAVPVSEEEILLESRPVSEERRSEFIRLAKESKLLRPRVPHEYEGYFEKAASQSNSVDGLRTTITKIAQFQNEDAFLFFGTIHNDSSMPIELGAYQGLLKIGKHRFYPPNILNASKPQLKPNETATFEGLLIGDGNSQSLHLDLENDFIFHLSKTQ